MSTEWDYRAACAAFIHIISLNNACELGFIISFFMGERLRVELTVKQTSRE